ncbi:hypothetical protein BGZ60DRAFT_70106 [Tricladium varicosporioides]|nr:hypothetical protein BGZ60DRAFT_70106 [Hymenoscyphus varicosporioides]
MNSATIYSSLAIGSGGSVIMDIGISCVGDGSCSFCLIVLDLASFGFENLCFLEIFAFPRAFLRVLSFFPCIGVVLLSGVPVSSCASSPSSLGSPDALCLSELQPVIFSIGSVFEVYGAKANFGMPYPNNFFMVDKIGILLVSVESSLYLICLG